jgi:TetR/AcrR family transcriptional regulator, repressor for neighboring sulfatase
MRGDKAHDSAARRVRRTAEEARRVILDAAEARVSHAGPAGLRLQDVAADAGLSHPVILHHFGSRDGLLRALNERILEDLRARLFAVIESAPEPSPDIVDRLLEDVFAVFRGGLAQRLAWLGVDAVPRDDPPSAIFRSFVDGIHDRRLATLRGDPPAERSDTAFVVYLVAVAALGDAVFGKELLGHADPEAAATAQNQFRLWLSRLLQLHLAHGP